MFCRLVSVWQSDKTNISCDFVKMEKTQLRAVICNFYLKGVTLTEIKAELDSTLSKSDFCWKTALKHGRMNTDDEPCNGRPKTAATPDMHAKIPPIVLDDGRVKFQDITDIVGISAIALNPASPGFPFQLHSLWRLLMWGIYFWGFITDRIYRTSPELKAAGFLTSVWNADFRYLLHQILLVIVWHYI